MLEKLFTSKNRIKILNFLLFEKSESHIREISRKLNVPVSAVKREIDNLNSTELLNINKNKISLNKNCNYLKDLKNIFVKTEAIVYPIKRALTNKKIQYAFLFGSFVRGDYHEDSDVDLMVVGDLKSFDLYKLIRPAENIIKRDINPVVWTLESLKDKKDTGFIRDIFKKGIIMIKGNENELRKIIN